MKVKLKYSLEDLIIVKTNNEAGQITGLNWRYFSSCPALGPKLDIDYFVRYDWENDTVDGILSPGGCRFAEKDLKRQKGNGLKNIQVFDTSSLFGNSIVIGADVLISSTVPTVVAPRVYEIRGFGYKTWIGNRNEIFKEPYIIVKDKLDQQEYLDHDSLGELIYNKDHIIPDITEEWLIDTLSNIESLNESYINFFKYFDLLEEAKYLYKTIQK